MSIVNFKSFRLSFLIAFLAIIVFKIFEGFCWHVRISENFTFLSFGDLSSDLRQKMSEVL